jgi:uncharacterized protein (DUF2062 family)
MVFSLKKITENLLGINDSPNKIALGFGLGLFLGVLPGTGVIAAVVCAVAFRVNKAASLSGSLLVNTWINVVAFPLALVVGGFIFRIDPSQLEAKWLSLLDHFTWNALLDYLILYAVLAVFVGYLLLGVAMGIAGYAICLFAIVWSKKRAALKNDSGN